MTLKELKATLDGCGIKFRYDHWEERQAPALPYGVYYTDGAAIVCADGGVALTFTNISVDLWTKTKDLAAENKLETALNSVGIAYSKGDTSYDNSEKAYVTTYEFQI